MKDQNKAASLHTVSRDDYKMLSNKSSGTLTRLCFLHLLLCAGEKLGDHTDGWKRRAQNRFSTERRKVFLPTEPSLPPCDRGLCLQDHLSVPPGQTSLLCRAQFKFYLPYTSPPTQLHSNINLLFPNSLHI